MSEKFKKTVEDFVCGHCGYKVKGDGFTNHCSMCLWSKHVDVFPGDRGEKCGGLMEPVGLKIENGKEIVVHKCTKCGKVKVCKVSKKDNRDEVIKISQKVL
jgi:predicted RNA-binding Zn-ribbon protein involved in translation (DUF1610 family)